MVPQMYINPSLITMIITLMLALLTVGGVLWRFSENLEKAKGEIVKDLSVLTERLNTHIKFCENNCPAAKPGAKRLP